MTNCIFCQIAEGATPTELIYKDDRVVAFSDMNPQAPTHLLIIPRQHVASLAELTTAHDQLWIDLLHVTQLLAKQQNLGNGFRVIVNTGSEGGQSVDHLHLHLLGGRPMNWPPG